MLDSHREPVSQISLHNAQLCREFHSYLSSQEYTSPMVLRSANQPRQQTLIDNDLTFMRHSQKRISSSNRVFGVMDEKI